MPRIAAALLIAFWNRDDEHVTHWIVKSLADVVFEIYPWGIGSAFDLAKFGIVEKEESDRRVIGLSAANKCIVLADMIEGMAKELGDCSDLLSSIGIVG